MKDNDQSIQWAVIGAYAPSLVNFRGRLIQELRAIAPGWVASEPASTDIVANLKKMDVPHYGYPVSRSGLSPYQDLQTLFSLWWLFRNQTPSHVLAYTVKPVIWSGVALKFRPNVKYTALITGLGFVFDGRSILKRFVRVLVCYLYRFALARADSVVFQNADNLEAFLRLGLVDAKKCHVVDGSGVPTDYYRAMPVGHEEPFTFLLIARLLGEKGIREYAAAARRLKRLGYSTRCVLVGPTDPSPDAINLAEVKAWVADEVIEYRGELVDVRSVIGECHVYVLPSYHEGMPRTVLEAMSMGRPILTTDVSGCRETVIPGENGWLIPKADTHALAERMIWFIENRNKLTAMGQASRQIAEERFDVRMINAEMVRIMGLRSREVA